MNLAFIGRESGSALGYEDDGKRFVFQVTGPWSTEIREGVHWCRVKGAELREIKASLRLGAGTAPTRGAAAPSGDPALDAGPEPSRAATLDAGAEPGGPAPAPSQDPRRAEAEPAGSADAEVLTAALYVLAAAGGIPLKADPKELLTAFRASFAEHGEVVVVDGMPDQTFTAKRADLGGEEFLAPASKNPGRPS